MGAGKQPNSNHSSGSAHQKENKQNARAQPMACPERIVAGHMTCLTTDGPIRTDYFLEGFGMGQKVDSETILGAQGAMQRWSRTSRGHAEINLIA